MFEILLTYITTNSQASAQRLILDLLERRLIGCATTFASNSFYWWQQSVQQEPEYLIIAKTLPEKSAELKKTIEELHTYDVPCILMFNAKTNESYFQWLSKEIKA
jgi:periplasmic divalent cation tolerance protein